MHKDPFFGPPYLDVDVEKDGVRYVHGGFGGTDTRFCMWFPSPVAWLGRSITFLEGGMGGQEGSGLQFAAPEVALANGAYLVDSNQGHFPNDMSGIRGDTSIQSYRASAASVRYSWTLAEEMYGQRPHHNYVYGGSGGGVRSIFCLEQAPDVWDGAVPWAINHLDFWMHNYSVTALTEPVLRSKLRAIADADDPFSVLHSDEERMALATLYRAGFPRGAEFLLQPMYTVMLSVASVAATDPEYMTDFWSRPGYEGHDDPAVRERVRRSKLTVRKLAYIDDVRAANGDPNDLLFHVWKTTSVPEDRVMGVQFEEDPGDLYGMTLRVAGREMLCTNMVGDIVCVLLHPDPWEGIGPGDIVEADNAVYTAYAHYHRHRAFTQYDSMSHLFVDGRPIYVQRPDAPVNGGYTGQFAGKMIMVQNLLDAECWPICAHEYARIVEDRSRFRLYWLDNAHHFHPITPTQHERLIDYRTTMNAALRDLIAWVEDDVEPAPSTDYTVGRDGRIEFAADRLGIQPVVRLERHGHEVIASIELPPGSDDILEARWEPAGVAAVPPWTTAIPHGASHVTLRVWAGRPDQPWARVESLGHLRL